MVSNLLKLMFNVETLVKCDEIFVDAFYTSYKYVLIDNLTFTYIVLFSVPVN